MLNKSLEITRLKNFFEGKCLHVSDYWLECCLDWFKSNHSDYSDSLLCNNVYEQWLLADLRDIEVRSLPPNLSTHKKYVLEGNYAVQLLFVKDISKSRLSQLNKIKNLYKTAQEVKDFQNVPQGKRNLRLYLTDGVLNVTGFEYKPLTSINVNTKPGTKLLLNGPLLIRNGEFLFEEKNITVLGGEIEELSVCNAYENILARELHLPENPEPNSVDENQINQSTRTDISVNQTNVAGNRTGILVNRTNNPVNQNNNPVNRNNNPVNRNNNPVNPITNSVNQTTNPVNQTDLLVNQNPTVQQAVAEFSEIDDLFLADFEVDEPKEPNAFINEQLFDDFDDDIGQLIASDVKFPVNVSGKPYNFIKQLTENRLQLTGKKLRVKAQFIRVVQKIAVSSVKGWTMTFEITDGTGNLVVNILSDVIEDLIGISPEQILSLKEKIKNKDVRAADRLKESLFNCKQKLLEMNCFLDILFSEEDDPTVVNLAAISNDDLHFINQRIDLK